MNKEARDFERNQEKNSVELERRFKKYVCNYGYKAEKLDKANQAYKAPDYFVSARDKGKAFFCECKYINSMGYDEQQNRISTLDSLFMKNKILKNGAITQLNYDKFQDKVIALAKDARKKMDSFLKNDPKHKDIYRGNKIPLVLCLGADPAFKSFLKPVISNVNKKLGEYIDTVALYRPGRYEKPQEMVYEEHNKVSNLHANGTATIKESGTVLIPLFEKYAGKIHYRKFFDFLPTSKLGKERFRNGC